MIPYIETTKTSRRRQILFGASSVTKDDNLIPLKHTRLMTHIGKVCRRSSALQFKGRVVFGRIITEVTATYSPAG